MNYGFHNQEEFERRDLIEENKYWKAKTRRPQQETFKQKILKIVGFLFTAIGISFAFTLPVLGLIVLIQWLIKIL